MKRDDWIIVATVLSVAAFVMLVLAPLFDVAREDEPEKPNVVLVIFDTARRDAFGFAGGPEGITPYVDRVASAGVSFTGCVSASSWTLPAVATVFTGVSPRAHGANTRGETMCGIPEDFTTLAEALHEVGYQTHLVYNVPVMEEDYGFWQGFDTVHGKSGGELKADEVTDAGIEFLDSRDSDRPFFLVLHYFDAHYPYDPPQEYWDALRVARPERMPSSAALERAVADSTLDPELRGALVALYLSEVHYVDSQIGRFMEEVFARGLMENTVFVVVGDHGEEFWEHGRMFHGNQLFGETIEVPFAMCGPGIRPRVVEETVGHADIFPTVAGFAGADVPPYVEGEDLLQDFGGPRISSGLRTGSGDRVVVTDGGLRIHWFPEREEVGYDLADGREDSIPAHIAGDQVEAMLEAADYHWTTPELFARRVVLNSEDRVWRLRDLGYFD